MSFQVKLNIKGTQELDKGVKCEISEATIVDGISVKPPTIKPPEKTVLGVKKHTYIAEDIKLVNSPTRLPKSTYPVRLYVNHDEIDLTNDWGWVGALRLFCDYCALVDHDKFLTLGDTKRGMGICLSRTKADLLVNIHTDQKKVVNWWGVWFNLDVPSKRDLGVAIFNIGEFMGFHCVAMEVKKWDNSDF